jgi:hypothetical protein
MENSKNGNNDQHKHTAFLPAFTRPALYTLGRVEPRSSQKIKIHHTQMKHKPSSNAEDSKLARLRFHEMKRKKKPSTCSLSHHNPRNGIETCRPEIGEKFPPQPFTQEKKKETF